MAVMEKTVLRARKLLARRAVVWKRIGGPFALPAFALFVVQESGDDEDAITGAVVGSWEVGATLRTVGKRTGAGSAKAANVDPLDRTSSYYGAQWDFADTLADWIDWLDENGFDPIDPDDAGAALTFMKAPYSMGWNECRALLRAGRQWGPEPRNPLACLRYCLELDDDRLPDIGPQTDTTIRLRIGRVLELPADAARVAPVVWSGALRPYRIAEVRPFPRWSGPNGLQARLRKLADAAGVG